MFFARSSIFNRLNNCRRRTPFDKRQSLLLVAAGRGPQPFVVGVAGDVKAVTLEFGNQRAPFPTTGFSWVVATKIC